MTGTEMRFALLTELIRINAGRGVPIPELTLEALVAIDSIIGDELDDN